MPAPGIAPGRAIGIGPDATPIDAMIEYGEAPISSLWGDDDITDFIYSTVATAPSPADSGESLVVATGDALANFPDPNDPAHGAYSIVICPASGNPVNSNAEKALVVDVDYTTDTIYMKRGIPARSIIATDQVFGAVLSKTTRSLRAAIAGVEQRMTLLENALAAGKIRGSKGTNYPDHPNDYSIPVWAPQAGDGKEEGPVWGYLTNSSVASNAALDPDKIAAQPYAMAYMAAATQSIPNATSTAIQFDTEVYDNDGIWSAGSPTRFTIQTPGVYAFFGNVGFTANSTGSRGFGFRLNGSGVDIWYGYQQLNAQGANTDYLMCAAWAYLIAGDYIEAMVWQNQGGPLNIFGGSLYYTSAMQIVRISVV